MSADRLRELVAQATPGPWEALDDESVEEYVVPWIGKTRADGQIDPIADDIQNHADARLIAKTPELATLAADMADALDKGRRFERAYQESLGATPTLPQWERLESLQSAFIDAYLDALARLDDLIPERDRR